MSWLLDVNLLLASRWTIHADHAAVRAWLDEQAEFYKRVKKALKLARILRTYQVLFLS